MLNTVLKTINRYNMIEDGDTILLGLSGGVDSMALLYILLELREKYNFNLFLAHVNHSVRGEYALRDQKFAENTANKLKLPFFTTTVDMNAYAKEHKITSEEAGRILRYGFFNEILSSYENGKIAVAHNLNDQAETLLMRFMRGTGIDGLRGIEHRVGNIIRPILDISREELETYIKENDIEITQDDTNFETIYTRNKIRLELLPYIMENFNPNIIKTLERTAYLADIDSNFLEREGEKSYKLIVDKVGLDNIYMDRLKFTGLDISMKYRVLRRAILELNKTLQGISEVHLTSIIDVFTSGETGKEITIANDIVCTTSYNSLIVGKRKSLKDTKFEYILKEDVIMYNEGYSFKSEIIDYKQYINSKKEKDTVYFDYNNINGSLRFRSRKNGDKFTPYGMRGKKKIKDYFIDEKIPRDEREDIPLLVDDENILWVVGYRTSELYKITKDTDKILKIMYKRV